MQPRRFYSTDEKNRHLWLHVYDSQIPLPKPNSSELARKLRAAGLPIYDAAALDMLGQGIGVISSTGRADADVLLEAGKEVQQGLLAIKGHLPLIIEDERKRAEFLGFPRSPVLMRYRLTLRLAKWILNWTFMHESHDLKRPRTLWHTDAKWLACALSQACSRPGEFLTISAQGSKVSVPPAAKLLKEWIPNCGGSSEASIVNTLSNKQGAGLKGHEHTGNKLKYPLHANGWKARIS